MLIDWTPFDVKGFEPELDEDGEAKVRVWDGTDTEFYESPWNEADEGQVFASQWSDGEIVVGRKEDDAVIFWEPIDQEGARARLVLARKCWLHNMIEIHSKELAALGGWDG